MKTAVRLVIALASLVWGHQAAAQSESALNALAQDVRLATVADRLLTANRLLCRQQMPVTGLILHSRDQYRNGAEGNAFANGPIAVAAVLPGTPAAGALHPGDGLAAIGPVMTSDIRPETGDRLRVAAHFVLAEQPAAGPVTLTVVRDGREQAVTLAATPGCRAVIELNGSSLLNATSDGKIIQVNSGIVAAATDEELAVVFAHEMAHLVLEHRRRLEQAGAEKGILGEFGGNQQLNRQVEVEADRMTAHLLANAGYDPRIAPAFWRSSLGRRAGGGIFRSRIYPSSEARAQLVEREIADYLGGGAPSYPGHLLGRRDTPFK